MLQRHTHPINFSKFTNYLEPQYFMRFLRQEFYRDLRTDKASTVVQIDFLDCENKRGKIDQISEKIAETIFCCIRRSDLWTYFQEKFYICYLRCSRKMVEKCFQRLYLELRKMLIKKGKKNYKIEYKYFTYFELSDKMIEFEFSGRQMVDKNDFSQAGENFLSNSFHSFALPLDWRFFVPSYSIDYQKMAKRLIDLILAIIFLIINLPLALIIALAIYIDSPGPIIFRQKRLGQFGKPFYIYKFRTMKVRKENDKQHENLIDLITSGNSSLDEMKKAYMNHINSCITRIGRFLRKTSLDELPQIINILKNDMSFVGPRPHPVYEVEKYKKWYYQRLMVKPGLTGLSKVLLRFSPENYEESMRLDIRYVREWSIWLDLKILLNTFKALLIKYED